jgi:hypothetical protein
VGALSIAPGFSQGYRKEEKNAASKTLPKATIKFAAEQNKA